MIRILSFVIFVFLLAAGFAWLADRPGELSVTWQGMQYQVTLLVAVTAIVVLIAVVMFATQVKAAALFTIPADLVRSQDVALVWGLSGAAGSLGGAVFQLIVGWLIDSYSYAPVFTLVVGLHFISTLLVIWLIPRVELLPYGTPE